MHGMSSDAPANGNFDGREQLRNAGVTTMHRERPFGEVLGAVAYWHTKPQFYPLPRSGGARDPLYLGGMEQSSLLLSSAMRHYANGVGQVPPLTIGEHVVDMGDSHMVTQRVGPFVTVGGWDWTTIFWTDAFYLQGLLDRGERQFMSAHVSAVVDMNGTLIPTPPLHVHHVHIAPGLFGGINPHRNIIAANLQTDGSTYIEHHGDFQCLDSRGGMTCLGETYDEPKALPEAISISAQVNDVRSAGSPPLQWYYQISLRLLKPDVRPPSRTRSLHYLMSPAGPGPFGTFSVSCMYDSFSYSTGQWPVSGKAVGVKVHAHQFAMKEMLLTSAAPHELGLGLGALAWGGAQADNMVKTVAAVGYNSSEALREALLDTLTVSLGVEGAAASLLCQAIGEQTRIDGRLYDRAATILCRPFAFKPGDRFTSILFFGPSHQFGPKCNEFSGGSSIARDKWLTMHATWWVEYLSDDNISYYTVGMYAQNNQSLYGLLSHHHALVRVAKIIFGDTGAGFATTHGFPLHLFVLQVVVSFFESLLAWFAQIFLLGICLTLFGCFVRYSSCFSDYGALKRYMWLIPLLWINCVIVDALIRVFTTFQPSTRQLRMPPEAVDWTPPAPVALVATSSLLLIGLDVLVLARWFRGVSPKAKPSELF
eukprot:4761915-Prymnesium_polylepis.1